MIADASLIILLARADRLGLLQQLFDGILIPQAVHDEVFADPAKHPEIQAVAAAVHAGWMRSAAVPGDATGRIIERFPNLGLGEAACIALALQRHESTLLIDDGAARRAATLSGIRPVGCLGVIARSYHRRLLPDKLAVAAAVRGLLDAGLWVGADVIEVFWDRLGGRR